MRKLTPEQSKALDDYLSFVYLEAIGDLKELEECAAEQETKAEILETDEELALMAFLYCKHVLRQVFPNTPDSMLLDYSLKVFYRQERKAPEQPITTEERIKTQNKFLECFRDVFKKFDERQLHSLYYNPMLNGLYQISKPKLEVIPALDQGKYSRQGKKHSVEFMIANLSKAGTLSTSMRKLFFTASMLLAEKNFYRGDTTIAAVELSVDEYAEKLGKTFEGKYSREKLIRDIHTDLSALENIYWNGTETKGNKLHKYDSYRIFSSHKYDKTRGVYRICFDVDTAETLQHSYPAMVHESLLRVDNKNPAAFSIGYKIAIHSEIDNNYNSGTGDVLRVSTILENTSEIMTAEEFRATGRKDWRKLIKERLEKALDELKDKKFLKRWEYRNEAGKVLTREKASELGLDEYVKLKVEYTKVMMETISERRTRKAKEKEEALKGRPKRKRGRPKKQPEELSET